MAASRDKDGREKDRLSSQKWFLKKAGQKATNLELGIWGVDMTIGIGVGVQ